MPAAATDWLVLECELDDRPLDYIGVWVSPSDDYATSVPAGRLCWHGRWVDAIHRDESIWSQSVVGTPPTDEAVQEAVDHARKFLIGRLRNQWKPTSAELRIRIEALYMERTGSESPHRAQTWFAEQSDVEVRTVQRWIAGDRQPGGPVLKLLERMERVDATGGRE